MQNDFNQEESLPAVPEQDTMQQETASPEMQEIAGDSQAILEQIPEMQEITDDSQTILEQMPELLLEEVAAPEPEPISESPSAAAATDAQSKQPALTTPAVETDASTASALQQETLPQSLKHVGTFGQSRPVQQPISTPQPFAVPQPQSQQPVPQQNFNQPRPILPQQQRHPAPASQFGARPIITGQQPGPTPAPSYPGQAAPPPRPMAQQPGQMPRPVYPGQPLQRPYMPGQPLQPAMQPPRQPLSLKKFVVWGLVVCIILSFLCGFGGQYLSNSVTPEPETEVIDPADQTPAVVRPNPAVEPESGSWSVVADSANSTAFIYNAANERYGSGVLVSANYLLTDTALVSGADMVTVVFLDGTQQEGIVVEKNTAIDIAVVQISSTKQPVPLGKSDTLRVGDKAFAVYILQTGLTITDGIISAFRKLDAQGSQQDLLQTSTPMLPGSAGGGLYNVHGELIGILLPTYSVTECIGYAMPIDIILANLQTAI